MPSGNSPALQRLFIEELAPGPTGVRRKFVFRGHEAPKGHPRSQAAFHLGGGLRRVVSAKPGVQTPSVSVLGTKERDITFRFHWRDSLSGIDGDALEKMRLLDSIRLSAIPLRVVWGDTFRRGLIVDLDLGVEGGADFENEITIEVYDQGKNQRGAKKGLAPLALPTSVSDFADTIATSKASLVSVPGLSFDLASGIESVFGSVLNPIGALLAIGEDLQRGIADADQALTSAVNNCAALRRRLDALIGYLSSVAVEIETADALAAAAFERARIEAMAALTAAGDAVFELGLAAEKKVSKAATTARSIITRAGDTLESIAATYKTTLAVLVSLNPGVQIGGALPAGTRLRIPG